LLRQFFSPCERRWALRFSRINAGNIARLGSPFLLVRISIGDRAIDLTGSPRIQQDPSSVVFVDLLSESLVNGHTSRYGSPIVHPQPENNVGPPHVGEDVPKISDSVQFSVHHFGDITARSCREASTDGPSLVVMATTSGFRQAGSPARCRFRAYPCASGGLTRSPGFAGNGLASSP